MEVKVGDLAKAIERELRQYNKEVLAAVNLAGERVADEGANMLRETSPRRTGRYAKGWRVRKTEGRHEVGYVIHNKTNWQLTHLLEHGHVKRGGGRVQGRPHITPVEQHVTAAFESAVVEAIK